MKRFKANKYPAPYFIFPDIPVSGEFSFEKLTQDNFQQLYLMFENDDNAFTDYRFKDHEGAALYFADLKQFRANSPKHGGNDWFFLYNNEYAGILHLYDLSRETFAENNRRCWIGYATKPALRNKGITKKVLRLFIQYIFENYQQIRYIHVVTEKSNMASQALLLSAGFKRDNKDRPNTDKYDFFCLTEPFHPLYKPY